MLVAQGGVLPLQLLQSSLVVGSLRGCFSSGAWIRSRSGLDRITGRLDRLLPIGDSLGRIPLSGGVATHADRLRIHV